MAEVAHFAKKERFHFFPGQRKKHGRHRFFLGIPKVDERFLHMNDAVVGLREFLLKEFEEWWKSVALGSRIEIDEIAPRSAARERRELHAGDIAHIGNSQTPELFERKEQRVAVTDEAHLGTGYMQMEGLGRFGDEGKFRQRLQGCYQHILVKGSCTEEIKIDGPAMAKMQCQSSSACQIKVSKSF